MCEVCIYAFTGLLVVNFTILTVYRILVTLAEIRTNPTYTNGESQHRVSLRREGGLILRFIHCLVSSCYYASHNTVHLNVSKYNLKGPK